MRRTQIYITEEQSRRIEELAATRSISKAEVIRRILDEALDSGDTEAVARAGILATAGVLPEAPSWQEWLESVRRKSADERLIDLGL